MEATVAVVAVEDIGFAEFDETGGADDQTAGVFGMEFGASGDLACFHEAGIADVIGAIAGDVEIERTVAVDIGEGEGGAARGTGGSGGFGGVVEAAALVMPAEHASGQGGDEKFRELIAVEVGEHRAAADFVGEAETGVGGGVLESPASEVAVEGGVAGQAAEEEVGTTVAVIVADGHAAAVFENAVGGAGEFGEMVGEGDAGGVGWEEEEPGSGVGFDP